MNRKHYEWPKQRYFEGFNTYLEEVGEVVHIPDDAVDLSHTEDIDNVQDCEGTFKKFISYRQLMVLNMEKRN